MTIAQTLKTIKVNNPKISVTYIRETAEYRMTFKCLKGERREDMAYYTPDSDDAINTARSMQVFFNEGGNFK